MAKVSIGLRGWRFEEEAVFTDDGEFRDVEAMDEGVRERLSRLPDLVSSPCDACYLVHGEEDVEECEVAEVVYGEPRSEVVLCSDHERDLVYWYQECDGSGFRGMPEFQSAFYDWFQDGNRAPESFEGIEHVDTDPMDLPSPTAEDDREERWEVEDRIDLRDVDMDQEYPTE